MSHTQSSLALEIKEDLMEPELDLFIREKHLSVMGASSDCDAQVIKVRGSITVSF